MRIIAGSKKGMRLISPQGDVSRPIIDRIKESLFSVLYKYDLPADAVVADIFSGVGSLGLEALSRGAKFVTFVEQDIKIGATLSKNIAKGGFEESSKIVRANAFSVGAGACEAGRYNLLFVDPPYVRSRDAGPDSQLAGLMRVLVAQAAEGAIVAVRTEKTVDLAQSYGPFEMLERRKWGSMAVGIFSNGRA